ncbi:lysophospholipid acyltransferase family protein [Streptomyces qinglanensis]|uniref:1-acyl-sn-glycerol-3-phosphate acyltransferases n=1 Tax=Streptomyces qinglanensis TaxID=943816 RepID=A0A1H9QXU2_9ACTN|nr:lysophospholipid acyltransferase family protein [Streptomyces qinglanensis]SER65250.1 1-acyl-sn-glycerol-3-phosphate acyltransferases [Streptomyces qinglanensis]
MSCWAVASPCTVRCAAHRVPPVAAAVRARRCAALAGALLRGLASGPDLACGEVLRTQARGVVRALGATLEAPASVSGPRRPGEAGSLIVSDHISWLDALALLAVEPATALAKREVAQWPLFGPLAERAGVQFIDRDRFRTLPDTVAQVADVLRGGRSVLVFPQGTTWCTESGSGFRRALFQAAIDAEAPVRPVTVSYRQDGEPSTVAAFLGDDTFAASLHRVISARNLAVRVTPHPALHPAPDRRALAAAAHAAIRGTRAPAHP